MHLRFSSCKGLPVFDEATGAVLGAVSGILIHPDTAAVEGFFVGVQGFLQSKELFLASPDIVHWGTRIRVRSEDSLVEAEEIVRLQTLLEDGRTVLGQKMVTESGVLLGVCTDVQIDTKLLQTEWLFPKKLWRWRRAVPVSAVVEVRTDAIIVRDPLMGNAIPAEVPLLQPLKNLTKAGMGNVEDAAA